MRRRADWLAAATLAAVAGWYVHLLVRAAEDRGARSYDIYFYFYPVMVQTARAVLDGGQGLFWNRFQNCGQPLFGSGTTGILYPPAVLSLFLDPDLALLGVLLFNLAVGSVGAYFLCRELGVGILAAWCGALAFGLGNTSVDLVTFTPLVSGPWAWVPVAMLFCERILREPTAPRAVGLAVAIGLALIPGHPQAVLYLYQLIALRVVYELVTRRHAVRGGTVAMLALGLALPPLLVAVQWIPALEVMRASVRNVTLNVDELRLPGLLSWKGIRELYALRREFNNPFILAPFLLGSLAFLSADFRRYALFYGLVGVLCVDLALGPSGLLFPIYMTLPFGMLFRDPGRFLWITSFCLSVLVAVGVEAFLRADLTTATPAKRVAVVALPALAAVGLALLSPGGLWAAEWGLVAAVVAACLMALLVPHLRMLAGAVLAVTLLLDLMFVRPMPYRHLIPDGDVLYARAGPFSRVKQRMTPQHRLYVAPPPSEPTFQQKTGALFGVPTICDYTAQPTKRYAEFFTMMRRGKPMTSLNDWLYPRDSWLPAGFNRRLLDLTASRYLMVPRAIDRTHKVFSDPPLTLERGIGLLDARVYRNPTALPRAFYVPRIEVAPDPKQLLHRLAFGTDDPRRVALVESAPADGFLGSGAAEAGTVAFERDDAEHLVLRVSAPQRGFLFLADQDFPGWSATVNGAPAPISRANYVFRLVPVPAGDSVVEFRYAPMSVRIGALISAITWVGVGVLLVWSRRQRRAGVLIPSP